MDITLRNIFKQLYIPMDDRSGQAEPTTTTTLSSEFWNVLWRNDFLFFFFVSVSTNNWKWFFWMHFHTKPNRAFHSYHCEQIHCMFMILYMLNKWKGAKEYFSFFFFFLLFCSFWVNLNGFPLLKKNQNKLIVFRESDRNGLWLFFESIIMGLIVSQNA